VKKIEEWMIILGLINLALLILSLIFFVPKSFRELLKFKSYLIKKENLFLILIIFAVVGFHLIEVNLIDPSVTEWSGADFTDDIHNFEGDTVFWSSEHWTPVLVYFFVIMYIAVYPFTLWFAPAYFIMFNEKKSLKTLAYGLLLVYVIALPFYLFIPITNVYTYYNLDSALETVIPSVESFFYSTTTHNNCLPSLHTAMTILIAWSINLTGNKRLTYFAYFVMISVIISVIYLAIHWITDVIIGAIIAVGVIFILEKTINRTLENE
jgi:membrane-associated phospholipid phosphatase